MDFLLNRKDAFSSKTKPEKSPSFFSYFFPSPVVFRESGEVSASIIGGIKPVPKVKLCLRRRGRGALSRLINGKNTSS